MSSSSCDEHWKQFHGTELGSLLAGIYGGTKPKINYPKIKKDKHASNIEDLTWRPISNKPYAVDPRKTTRRKVDLDVPKMRGGKSHAPLALIDCIPKRKNEIEIRQEIEDIKEHQVLCLSTYYMDLISLFYVIVILSTSALCCTWGSRENEMW